MIRRWFPLLALGCALAAGLSIAAPLARAQQSPAAAAPAAASPAAAPPAGSPTKDAGKHFRRGVALYSETDYRGALVEFRRAYEIAPNTTVLYNIGQTYYQLQNYAAALTAFERYLTEAGTGAPHRREVEQTIDLLRTRVGKLRVTANLASCEITVDDELVGRTPLDAPIVVSVGRRKITAMSPGRTPDTRFVEVPAGDTVEVALTVAQPGAPAGSARGDGGGGVDLVTPGWIATGAFAAGAIGTGIWAYVSARQLDDARKTFPTTRGDLDRRASRASTSAIVADVFTAATVVAGAITLKLTLSRAPSHEVHVAVVPGGIELAGVWH
jgi:Flp pilus assembly protein TadD